MTYRKKKQTKKQMPKVSYPLNMKYDNCFVNKFLSVSKNGPCHGIKCINHVNYKTTPNILSH